MSWNGLLARIEYANNVMFEMAPLSWTREQQYQTEPLFLLFETSAARKLRELQPAVLPDPCQAKQERRGTSMSAKCIKKEQMDAHT